MRAAVGGGKGVCPIRCWVLLWPVPGRIHPGNGRRLRWPPLRPFRAGTATGTKGIVTEPLRARS